MSATRTENRIFISDEGTNFQTMLVFNLFLIQSVEIEHVR